MKRSHFGAIAFLLMCVWLSLLNPFIGSIVWLILPLGSGPDDIAFVVFLAFFFLAFVLVFTSIPDLIGGNKHNDKI